VLLNIIPKIFVQENTMAEKQAGVTALVTAFARAYHATHDDPLIFADNLADRWFTDQERAFFEKSMSGLLPLLDPQAAAGNPDNDTALAISMQLMNCPVTLSRSRYSEDSLRQAVNQGVWQYVILGAGFDTFTWRRPEWADAVQVFEVDHPTTQQMKRERMAIQQMEIPAQLHFLPVDFESQNFREVLLASDYQTDRPGFFSWLGVSLYLTREAILHTLADFSALAAPQSEMVFDYVDLDALDSEKASPRMNVMRMIVQQSGEPIQTGFDPNDLAEEVARLGMVVEEDLSPVDIESRYFTGRRDRLHAFEHFHIIRVKKIG
jgi:methyltransferase (TIGR00027 family)